MCFVEIRHIWKYDESGSAMDLLLVHVGLRGEFKQKKEGWEIKAHKESTID